MSKKKDKTIPKPYNPKTSKMESAKRVYQIYQWLKLGYSTQKIIAKCKETYGIRLSQSEKYLRRARDWMTEEFQKEFKGQLPDILHKLDAIYRKGFEEGEVRYTEKGDEYVVYDASVARQALLDKAKLLGLVQNKMDLTINDDREYTDVETETLETAANVH